MKISVEGNKLHRQEMKSPHLQKMSQKRRVFQPPLLIGERMRQIRFRQQVPQVISCLDRWLMGFSGQVKAHQPENRLRTTDLISFAKIEKLLGKVLTGALPANDSR